jgi:hypothetical protein
VAVSLLTAAGVSATGTTAGVTLPGSIPASSWAYLVVNANLATAAPSLPGWTLVASNGTGPVNCWLFVRSVGPSDSGTAVSVSLAVSTRWHVGVTVVSGGNQDALSAATTSVLYNATQTVPALTPVLNGCVDLVLGGLASNTAAGAIATTPPTGFTEDLDSSSATGSGNDISVYVAHRQLSGQAGVSQAATTTSSSPGARAVLWRLTVAPTVSTDRSRTARLSQQVLIVPPNKLRMSRLSMRVLRVRGISVTVGVAAEVDAGSAVTVSRRAVVGVAAETDAAAAVKPVRSRTVGTAAETDAAAAVHRGRLVTVGTAAETDAAAAVHAVKLRLVGRPIEHDAGSPVLGRKRVVVGSGAEVDAAITLYRNVRVGTAVEVDAAQAGTVVELIPLGIGVLYADMGDVTTGLGDPVIWWLSTSVAHPADTVVIVGSGFGAAQADWSGAVEAYDWRTDSWSDVPVDSWVRVAADAAQAAGAGFMDGVAKTLTPEHEEIALTVSDAWSSPGYGLRVRVAG